MSKTTRELANLFGVTKQAIEKKYTPEFKAKYMSKVTTNGVPTWLVDDEGVNVLKSIFQDTNQTTNLGTNEVPTDDKILGVLEEQIKSQKNQIESLQKLLDQSQQLLLSEQKKSQLLIENQTPKTDVSREWKEKQAVLDIFIIFTLSPTFNRLLDRAVNFSHSFTIVPFLLRIVSS